MAIIMKLAVSLNESGTKSKIHYSISKAIFLLGMELLGRVCLARIFKPNTR
jgi:hypothetical protein